jgi:pimeloyl-ACP methyl ester carboxylesterase
MIQPQIGDAPVVDNPNRTYVLVAGAWHGGWVWRDVIPALRTMGHAVSAPTLTGLGERRHSGHDADLEMHVEDIVAHLEMEDLHDVTLVGWSYGGMVITGALARVPGRVKSMIYLDAFVPEDGAAAIDYFPPEARAIMDAHKNAGSLLPPLPLQIFGVTDPAIIDFVTPRLTHQPWRTFYQPVKALKFICCTGFGPTPFSSILDKLRADPGIRTGTIETSHLCMLTDPQGTIDMLVNAA